MLLQNPQLAYALLQAQVVMRIVDPETAVTMLHKTPPSVPPVGTAPQSRAPSMPSGPPNFGPPFPGTFLQGMNQVPAAMDIPGPRMDMHGPAVMDMPGPPRPGLDIGMHRMGGDQGRAPYTAPSLERDDGRAPPRDPRNRDPRDRGGSAGPTGRGPPNPGMPGQGVRPQGGGGRGGPQLPPHLAGADPEKAQLIMQVLQLTDEQIAVLPAEQRQSIMVLKDQIKQGPPR